MTAPAPALDLSRRFWYRWLLGSSVFFTGFGLATAWLGALPPASLWGGWIGEHFFGGPLPPDARTVYDFVRGPLGGTMAGFYLLQTFIVSVPLRRGEAWAWWAVVAGTGLWFVVDSAVSLAHGAWFNVLRVNLPALAVTGGGALGMWWTTPLRLRSEA